ncbi:hypothetical protein [Pseudomonas sp. COR18]|uniref:hypothetical protein n=1 Tax=Pseudomonas sp. COR18 TaxID=3399680 RepID=UPI003AFF95B6
MSEDAGALKIPEGANLIFQLWSSMGWPQSALLIGVLSVFVFRKDIKSLLERLRKVGAKGVTIAPPPLDPVQPEASSEKIISSAVGNTDHLKEYQNLLAGQKQFVINEIASIDSDKLIDYLVESLAFTRGVCFFERIFSFIFASQIVILKMLNDRRGTGMSKVDVFSMWEAHQCKYSPALDSWDGSVYIGFLSSNGLIMEDGDVVRISPIGVEFLMWMMRNGRSEVMRYL